MDDATVEALSCQELVELVTAYFDGALGAEDHLAFEDHVAGCRPCQIYLEQMRTTIRLAGRLTPESIPADAERELLAAFRSWKSA
jgi:anti-sigma factor RsiW